MDCRLPAWPGAGMFPKTAENIFSTEERGGAALILQNCLIPDEICDNPEIYYRSAEGLRTDHGSVIVKAGQQLVSNTYMNMLDVGAWKKYTTVEKLSFLCRIEGKGKIALIHQGKNSKKTITEVSYGYGDSTDLEAPETLTLQIELPEKIRSGMIFFILKAQTETRLREAEFRTDELPENRISLSLVICTYKRREYLEKNLEKIRNDSGLQKLSQEKRFIVRVIDNARELSDSYGTGIRVFPNENTGGSGGFSRGMEESVKEKEQYQTSHVILMDDDVKLQTESLRRLYALLSYMKPEYRHEPVAGRMFRLDHREIQYTAAEIWNGGDLRHIGWNQDMTQENNLPSMNENEGAEYGGWWFACYPMEFVEKNRPLPFFLHCDDVEYGLRHGGTPIILNGIQVWHETYEYRQSPVMAYYDTRNALIVNAIYQQDLKKNATLSFWKKELDSLYNCEDKESAYARLLGIIHYCVYSKKFVKSQPQDMSVKETIFKRHLGNRRFHLLQKIVFKIWNFIFYNTVFRYRHSYRKTVSQR